MNAFVPAATSLVTRRARTAMAAVMTLLLLWSTSVLSAWCGDPATHWQHPGSEQSWLQSKGPLGLAKKHCAPASGPLHLAVPTSSAEEQDSPQPDNAPPPWLLDHPPAAVTAVEPWAAPFSAAAASLPLYLVYQRLLIPFPA